nr:MAG TPA: hypothetical protein [Caudoviricetes sp.]
MTKSEAIEELTYDCNELGKAIPCDTSWGSSFENAYEMAIQALEKIEEYEDLEGQNRLVELPCKVGDTVFNISENIILEYEVVGFSVDKAGVRLIYGEHHVNGSDETYSCNLAVDKIGETVFFTKPKAEAKLKELRGVKDGK